MSIQVENSLKNTENKDIFNQKVHYMPCKIEEDGSANVKQYFETYIEEDKNGELKTSFRGHPLNGAKTTLPEGYQGILVTEAKRPLAENAERRFQEPSRQTWIKTAENIPRLPTILRDLPFVAGGFKEFINWNWDKKPSINDNIVKALDWIDIAEAIHGD